jgi:hypothetical protein
MLENLSMHVIYQQTRDSYYEPRLESTDYNVYNDAIVTYTNQRSYILQVLEDKKMFEIECNKDIMNWETWNTHLDWFGYVTYTYTDRLFYLNAMISKPFLG